MGQYKTQVYTDNIHRLLAHSYATYFILFLIGVTLDIIFRFTIFKHSYMMIMGVVLLLLATALILWAQKAGRDLKKVKEVKTETFCHGPYCYTRSPTHWGLFFLMIGFGIIINAVFVVLTTLISFFISRFVFLNKEEDLLAEKYGTPYIEYKKQVKMQ